MYPDDNYEPSGKALPRILRNGRKSDSSSSSSNGGGSNSSSSISSSTTDEIEAHLQATVRVWQTLQQQIQRGEDHYVEESGSFNIYKGWDGFIDARLFETMPKRFDYRWFSASVSHTLSHQPWPPVPIPDEFQAQPARADPTISGSGAESAEGGAPPPPPPPSAVAAAVIDEDQNDVVVPTTKRKRVR